MFQNEELINNQYEVERCLTGGMGYVYVVRDQVTSKRFALKTLKDELKADSHATARFEREARHWINLGHHQHIVNAIAFLRGEQPLLLLEYVDGLSLHQLIRAEPGGLAFSDVLNLTLQMSAGLNYAHHCPLPDGRQGVIHRDLKPANIMLTKTRTIKLTDFGLARAHGDSNLTSSNRAMGTWLYMPPEQFDDAHSVTAKADVYSFGMVMYEMVTGTLPFEIGPPPRVFHQVLNVRPEPISKYRNGADSILEQLIASCLEKAPENRPSSIHEVHDRLGEIQSRIEPDTQYSKPCSTCGYTGRKEHQQCVVCGTMAPRWLPPSLPRTTWNCTCGFENPTDFRFCMRCAQWFCDACEEVQQYDFLFCCRCGRSR